MLIGIDVGGTYTDAVLTDGKDIIRKFKTKTLHEEIMTSILNALDKVIQGEYESQIKRVVISTTLVTNIIAEKKYPPVALILLPGPGLSLDCYRYDTFTQIISGAIDYRGREITSPDESEIISAGSSIIEAGYQHVAVIGKFSNRNNAHEHFVKQIIEKKFPKLNIYMGHNISGLLNYPRRIATTMLHAAASHLFSTFCDNVSESLKKRNISAPAFILKADGGTIPLTAAAKVPVETIFSGPAASTLGAMCLSPKGQTSVVADIGGTTTDLSLILSGKPLIASKGADVEGFLTHVRSFAVRSVPLGGDSTVTVNNGKIDLLPERRGPAYCLGGPEPTPTDALKYLGRIEFGDMSRAVEAMENLASVTNSTPRETAQKIVFQSCQTIVNAIEQMFKNWEQEPAYRIWEIMQKNIIRPDNIVGVGGAAGGLIPDIAKMLNCNSIVPEHAEVANALGSAAAQPTLTVTLRIDTEQGSYTVLEDGSGGPVNKSTQFTKEDAVRLARDCLLDRAGELNMKEYLTNVEVVHCEMFNMVRGWTTTGKIFDVSIQTPQEILFYMDQGESFNE